MVKFTV